MNYVVIEKKDINLYKYIHSYHTTPHIKIKMWIDKNLSFPKIGTANTIVFFRINALKENDGQMRFILLE